ncbi:hypothetical protein GRAN_1559 [Granulicella sibirica]|uniref:Uncharacterized protein n=1 Tax=Granulicella sibirica TaxID=2479048 RepID=A0A4Q0T883_9BACT|nr:hypothetical protein GRAN_1559 [Granulicella sibirica]
MIYVGKLIRNGVDQVFSNGSGKLILQRILRIDTFSPNPLVSALA